MQSKRYYFLSWFITSISFQDLELVYLRSFEMNWQQTHRGRVFKLGGWEVRSYVWEFPLFVGHVPRSQDGEVYI